MLRSLCAFLITLWSLAVLEWWFFKEDASCLATRHPSKSEKQQQVTLRNASEDKLCQASHSAFGHSSSVTMWLTSKARLQPSRRTKVLFYTPLFAKQCNEKKVNLKSNIIAPLLNFSENSILPGG